MESTQIVKKSRILASPDRVWTALTDASQLATWFGAEFATPFVPGTRVVGRLVPTKVLPPVARRRKAYTGLPIELDIEKVEPVRLLAFRWSPLALFSPEVKAAAASLVAMEIAPDSLGSCLSITESDFEGMSGELLEKALEANASGWTIQIRQLELFLSGAIDLRPVRD